MENIEHNTALAITHQQGYVYLIKAQGSNPSRFKIGRTNNVERRLKEIATCGPYPLKIVDYFHTNNCVSAEKQLHEKMGQYRVWGEWFLLPYKYEINLDWFFIELKPKLYTLKSMDFINKECTSYKEYEALINELPF
jgi:hypothetical protein